MQELVIKQQEDESRIYAILENGNLVEYYEEKEGQARLEGNIYLGKVVDILPGMQAAFVDIGQGKNTFIHIKDILPKENVGKEKEEYQQKQNDIKKLIKVGDFLLVQVKRDSTNQKGARVSTHISLNSRYFVLMPKTDIITISQKIENQTEKERLLSIMKEILPPNYGVIIRTAAQGKKKNDLEQDLIQVLKKWEQVVLNAEKGKEQKKAVLIEANNDLLEKLLIDTIGSKINKIVVNSKELKQIVEKKLAMLSILDSTIEIRMEENISDLYELPKQVEKRKERKVWLKCGGFITIDKTEALVAIDVNSGKYTGNQNLEQTVLKVNQEATDEIAKQLRLRDIGGIIIIDYIDMVEEKHKREIEERLKEKLKKDRSKTQVIGFTKLNLLEMTRKHMISHE